VRPTLVLLTGRMLEECREAGDWLRDRAMKGGYKNKHGWAGSDQLARQQHRDAECGCKAASIVYNLKYEWRVRVNYFKRPDLGYATEVRTMRRLVIRLDDSDHNIFVLVRGHYPNPNWMVYGSIKGKAAKRPEWWGTPNDRPPCWWVPDEYLLPPNFTPEQTNNQQ